MANEIPEAQSGPPIYQQIAKVLRAQILDDASPEPDRLPSELELARIHGVARGTIRCALDVLADEGLITRSSGRPTVTNPAGVVAYQRLRHRRAIVVLCMDWSDVEDPTGYYGQIYQGILSVGEQAGYRCSLRWVEGEFRPVDIRSWAEDPNEVLGVINMHVLDYSLMEKYLRTGAPVVCVDFWPTCSGADGVVVDCFNEAHLAVDHLVANGHREIFYAGNIRGHGTSRQPEMDSVFMEAGYRRATHLAGLTASVERIYNCRTDETASLAEWFLSLQPRPTAGIVFSAGTLNDLLEELKKRGVCCPEDISLVTKNEEGAVLNATSIRTDAFNLGSFAAKLLLGRAAGEYPAGTRVAFESHLHPGPTVQNISSK